MKEKIRELFESVSMDAALFRSFPNAMDPNFAYFSGLSQKHYNSNLLLLTPGKKPVVFCGPLEFEDARKNKNIRAVLLDKKNAEKTLKQKIKGKTIGINLEYYPHSNWIALKQKLEPKKIVDIEKTVGNVRAEKTKAEVGKIKKACTIAQKLLHQIPDWFKKDLRETELEQQLHIKAIEYGIEELAFPTIVASGKNAAVPHHVTNSSKIKNNRFLLVDFGVKYQNYCSDLSRTFFVGKPTAEQEWAYWVVWETRQKAFEMLAPGIKAEQPFQTADQLLQTAFQQPLMHALGHGLGIKEHDFPTRMGPNETWKLKENQVLTIEPGVYKKNKFGIRIEDDVRITKNGAEWLSKAPSELVRL